MPQDKDAGASVCKAAGNRFTAVAGSVALALVALTIPLSVIIGRSAIAVSLGIAALAASMKCWPRWSSWPAPARMAILLMSVVLVGWLPSLAASVDPVLSASTWARTGALIAVLAALSTLLEPGNRVEAGLKLFVVAMSVTLVFSLLSLTVLPDLMAFRSGGGFKADRVLKSAASAIACALPVLLLAGWLLKGRWLWVAVSASVLGIAVVVLTHSRSGQVGIAAAALTAAMLWALYRYRARAGAALGVALALVAAVAVIKLPAQVPQESFGSYSLWAPTWLVDKHRQVIWRFTLERAAERPWAGWGINAINQAPGANGNIPEINHEFIPSHPHDWVVEVLAETGVVGLLPLIAVVLGVGVMAGAQWWRRPSGDKLAWLGLWVTFWVSSLSNFSFWSVWWQASAGALAILIWVFGSISREGGRP